MGAVSTCFATLRGWECTPQGWTADPSVSPLSMRNLHVLIKHSAAITSPALPSISNLKRIAVCCLVDCNAWSKYGLARADNSFHALRQW